MNAQLAEIKGNISEIQVGIMNKKGENDAQVVRNGMRVRGNVGADKAPSKRQ